MKMTLPFNKIIPHLLLGVYGVLLFLFAAYTNIAKPTIWEVLNFALLVLTILNLVTLFYLWKQGISKKYIRLIGLSFIGLYVLSIVLVGSRILNMLSAIFILREKLFILQLLGAFLLMPLLVKSIRNKQVIFHHQIALIVLSVTYVVSLIFIHLPIWFYLSSPYEFQKSLGEVIVSNLFGFGIILTLVLCCFLTYRAFLSKVSVFCAFVVFFYAFLFKENFGGLDQLFILNLQALHKSSLFYILEACVVVILFYASCVLLRFKAHIALIILIVFHVSTIWQTAWALVNYSPIPIQQVEDSPSFLPQDHEQIISFSKDETNVVVLMLDMLSSGLFLEVLNDHPSWKEELQGFVWYPQTLSISDTTLGSIGSLVGGWQYTPEQVNQLQTEQTLIHTLNDAYDTLIDSLKQKGYEISFVGPQYYYASDGNCYQMRQKGVACQLEEDYSSFWNQQKDRQEIPEYNEAQILVALALFRVAPFVWKEQIYNHGKWLGIRKFSGHYRSRSASWAFLQSLSQTPKIKEIGKTFKFFQNNLTHVPNIMSQDCIPLLSQYPDPQFTNFSSGKNTYYAAQCSFLAILQWIQWLQKNNIYDNTEIIILSDHGLEGTGKDMKSDRWKDSEYPDFSRMNALMMVKRAGGQGSLRQDNSFLSNADLLGLLCQGKLDCKGTPFESEQKNLQPNRTLPYFLIDSISWEEVISQPKLKTQQTFYLPKTIFEQKNWLMPESFNSK